MTENKLYKLFEQEVSNTGKKVMLSILRHMQRNTNLITINGDTLASMISDSKLSKQQIRDGTSELKKYYIIEPTTIRTEYIVNPTFAIKGLEPAVWKTYGELEVLLGNKNATIPFKGTVVLKGKNQNLISTDFKILGSDADEKKKALQVYYDN